MFHLDSWPLQYQSPKWRERWLCCHLQQWLLLLQGNTCSCLLRVVQRRWVWRRGQTWRSKCCLWLPYNLTLHHCQQSLLHLHWLPLPCRQGRRWALWLLLMLHRLTLLHRHSCRHPWHWVLFGLRSNLLQVVDWLCKRRRMCFLLCLVHQPLYRSLLLNRIDSRWVCQFYLRCRPLQLCRQRLCRCQGLCRDIRQWSCILTFYNYLMQPCSILQVRWTCHRGRRWLLQDSCWYCTHCCRCLHLHILQMNRRAIRLTYCEMRLCCCVLWHWPSSL